MMIRVSLPHAYRASLYAARYIHSGPLPTQKYADKLKKKAQDKGVDLEELKLQAREETRRRQHMETASLLASSKKANANSEVSYVNTTPNGVSVPTARKDSSPVKPLSSILNLTKLMATPHTSSQISALWTAYHASRAQGTGRGYICAALPLESYNAMACVAKKYPVFVAPVPRESSLDPSASETTGTAHEFFFLQWDFHPTPPPPSATEANPFEPVVQHPSSNIPEPSTVLFTPLQEYKLRTSFATPYLVLTFYTDLSRSHGIVLLRGEITPSATTAAVQSGKEPIQRFLLSQVDAQLLAMALQKFYLWGEGRTNGDLDATAETMLKQFHEEPDKFNWQDLLKFSDTIA